MPHGIFKPGKELTQRLIQFERSKHTRLIPAVPAVIQAGAQSGSLVFCTSKARRPETLRMSIMRSTAYFTIPDCSLSACAWLPIWPGPEDALVAARLANPGIAGEHDRWRVRMRQVLQLHSPATEGDCAVSGQNF